MVVKLLVQISCAGLVHTSSGQVNETSTHTLSCLPFNAAFNRASAWNQYHHAFNFAIGALAQAPVLPSQDPFYTQPANISLYQPGDVIAFRKVSSNLSGLLSVPGDSVPVQANYQLLYRTTDAVGNAVPAVTSIFVPKNAQPGKLLAYQTA